jgi:hypothetical protein
MVHGHTLLAGWMTTLISSSNAALYSMQDGNRPGLTSEGRRLAWWDGGPAFALASSGAVRLNFRGLFVYPASVVVRGELDAKPEALGWHRVACNVSAWALCSSEVGHVLPAGSPRMPERKEAVLVDGWNDLACAQSGGKTLVSAGVYDISACDVLDEGLDLLYTPGVLYHRHTSMAPWEYWVYVVLAVVLVRCLSYNVQSLWLPEGSAAVRTQWVPLGCSTALLALVLVDGDSIYVTQGDVLFFWCTVGYVGVYLVLHLGTRAAQNAAGESYEQPVFNVIVGTLQLVGMRFYTAAETPYNTVLVGMLASRSWTKMLLHRHSGGDNHAASLVLDSLYLSLGIELAFDGTREMLVGVLGVAFMAGQLLAR